MNKANIAYYSILYAGSSVLIKLIGFIIFLWIAREVDIDDYGDFGILYAIQTGLVTFAIAGIVEVVIGNIKKYNSVNKQKIIFSQSILFYVLFSIVSSLIILFLNLSSTKLSFDVLLIFFVVGGGLLSSFYLLQSQLMRLQEKHNAAILFHITPLFGFLFASISFYFFKNIESFFYGFFIGLLVLLPILFYKGLGHYNLIVKKRKLKAFFLAIIPFIIIAVLGWLSGYGNNLIINEVFEKSDVGVFTFLMTIASIIQLIANSLNMVWSPRFYNIVHKEPLRDVEIKNRKFYGCQALILGMSSGLLLFVFSYITSYLGGKFIIYQNMQLELLFLLQGYILLPIWWHCSNYYIVNGMGKELQNIVIATSIVGISVWIILMYYFGTIGIYIGFFVQMLLRSFWIYIKSRQYWDLNVSFTGVFIGILLSCSGYFIL